MPSQQPNNLQAAQLSGCMILTFMVFFGCMMPLIFVDLAETALRNLHLSPQAAVLVLIGMIFGSMVANELSKVPVEAIGHWD